MRDSLGSTIGESLKIGIRVQCQRPDLAGAGHAAILERIFVQGFLIHPLAITGLLLALVAGTVWSQRLPPSVPSVRNHLARVALVPVQVAPEPGIHSPLLAAAGLGLLGWGVGAVAGHAIQGNCGGDLCELEGIFYGGAAGGGLGLALGAHLGNRRRGNFLLDLLASGAVWGAGYGLMSSSAGRGGDTGVVVTAILLPPTQLLATVLVERASGRSRAGRSQAP